MKECKESYIMIIHSIKIKNVKLLNIIHCSDWVYIYIYICKEYYMYMKEDFGAYILGGCILSTHYASSLFDPSCETTKDGRNVGKL